MTGGGRRGRVTGKSRQVEGSGTVCAAHTHHIATPNTGSTADRLWEVNGAMAVCPDLKQALIVQGGGSSEKA